MKLVAESQLKAYLSERKKEITKRGSITNMDRDANPSHLMFRHVKIKPPMREGSDMRLSAADLVEGSSRSALQIVFGSASRDASPAKNDFSALNRLAMLNKSPTNDLKNKYLSHA